MAEVLLLEVGVMFAAIAAVSLLTARIALSPIPFYIGAGMLASPHVAGRLLGASVGESAFVAVGAELGIVLLLFFLGLEFSVGRLLAERGRMGRAGAVDLVVNFGVGLGLGWVLFADAVAALLTAGIVYISSSAVITKSMIDLGWIANPESGPILGTLVFEDLVIAVYLGVVSAFVLGGGSVETAALAVGLALAFLAGLVGLVWLGRWLFERVLETTSAEAVALRTLGVTVPIAGAALAFGVSEAVAAFFVGMAFGSTRHRHAIEEVLSPLRDTFAAVFFFWIGLLTDPLAVVGVLDWLVVAAVVTGLAKVASGFYGGRTYGLDARRSLRVGIGLVTRGEFSLIIGAAALASAGGALAATTAGAVYAFAVGYVLLMSVLGTVLMGSAGTVERLAFAAGTGDR